MTRRPLLQGFVLFLQMFLFVQTLLLKKSKFFPFLRQIIVFIIINYDFVFIEIIYTEAIRYIN